MPIGRLKSGSISREERETIIRTSENEDLWHIWTASPRIARKLDRIGANLVKDQGYAKFYTLPLSRITFRSMRKMVISEEVRERARRMLLARQNKH